MKVITEICQWSSKEESVRAMGRFLMTIIALTLIAERVKGNCPNLSHNSSCGVFRSCPFPGSEEMKCLKMAMNCDETNGRYYHCVKDVNGCYVQHCVRRVYCTAGQYPGLDLTKETAVCLTCPSEEFQTSSFWSNEQIECDYSKTKCDGEGEIECHPGTPSMDRTCKCDIQKNLALQGYAYNNRTCCSKLHDQECYCIPFKDQCPPGKVRHYNYKCLPECPQGLYRLRDSEWCIADNSSSKKYETSTAQTQNQDSQISTGMIIGLVVLVLFLITALVLAYCFKRRQKRKNKKGGMEAPQPVHNHEDNRNHIEMTHLLQEENNSSNIQKKKKKKDTSNIVTINAQFVNLGDKNNIEINDGKKLTWNGLESQNESHGASSLSTEENPVSVTPGESEESSPSHDINMDMGPKHPVEHEERDSALVEEDNQTKRKEVWTPPDQTKRKKVSNQPKVVIDEQTKRKEVWTSPEVVPDDQTKRKEVWTSGEVVPDDQTKRKEVWTSGEVVPDEQTKRKEVWTSPEN